MYLTPPDSRLMYEFSALHPMGVFMAHGHAWLKQILPAEVRERAKVIAKEISAQSLLVAPTSEGSSGSSAASSSDDATDTASETSRQSARLSPP